MEEVNCRTVRGSLWDYTAGTLDESGKRAVASHLQECRECGLHRAEVRSVSFGLKSLPQLNVSDMLGTRLRVIASRERARHLLRRNLAARFEEFRSRMKLLFDNLLRPIAIPAAGGLLASSLCFGMIVDTLQFYPDWDDDIPVGFYNQVAIDDVSPFTDSGGQDVLVQLTIDRNGNVIGYEVPQRNATPAELKEIGNLVIYSSFTPAMAFGDRVSSKLLVHIQHMNVRG